MVAFKTIILGAVLLLQFQFGSTIKLNEDGGYEILVALDENTPVPDVGVTSYVNNLKTSLAVFSSRMWVATKNHFYLKSVDILFPSHWNVLSPENAIPHNYENADIRLSPNATYPGVDNPNVCGQPGKFIELPSTFFNVTHQGPYGLHWKSLLHTWAMFRFGVHPEHGYVGDEKYPYITRDLRSNQWTVTGCTDEPVPGKFADVTNPDDVNCASGEEISNNCRFVPSLTGQNATTSLMHFHWIESVTEFCDQHNHNVHAQNKQNALCSHKSVWQVIRESPDYEKVTSPREVSVPAVKFRHLKPSSTPLLYILLDQGLVQGSFSIANTIPRILSNYITNNALQNTVAAIGAFPGNGNNAVADLVPWSELGANRNAFLDAIGQLKANGPLERDFSRALVEVASKIKNVHHSHGAVVLVVKYGADVENFGSYMPESEVINAFNENNIILNAIELNFPGHTGYTHLARLAQATAGSYVTLNNFGEAETNIRNVLNYVNRTLITEYTDLRKTWQTLRKETLTSSTTLSVPTDIKGSLEMFISTVNPQLTAANFSLTGYSNEMTVINLRFALIKSLDWNEDGSKWTYKLEVPQNQLVNVSEVSLALSCNVPAACTSTLLARAQSSEESEVKVEVVTSLENDQADLSNGRPISIFAKVTKNGNPVQYASVIAILTDVVSSRTTELRLLDEGDLAPDAQELDGIYSTYFAPDSDGQFRLSVTVTSNPTNKRKVRSLQPKILNESSFTRLLPIDQGDTGCSASSCEPEIINGTFSQTVELSSIFSVIQTSLYIPPPNKIISFFAIERPDLGQVNLYWVAPNIPGRFQTVSSYELRSAPSMELLINDFENQTSLPVPTKPKPPISLEVVNIGIPASTTYYAIRSVYRGKMSAISNIATVVVDDPVTSPTPTSPSSEPTSTPSGPTDSSTTPSGPTDPSSTPSGPTDPSSTPSGPTDPSSSTPTGPTDPSSSTPTGPTNSPTTPEDNSSTTPGPTNTTTPSTTSQPTNSTTAGNVKIHASFMISLLLVIISQIFC